MYIVYTHNMNTVINIRIDEKTKRSAQKTLEAMGLDLSSGVKLFLNQVVTENGIPFTPSKIAYTKRAKRIRARWDREMADALKNGKSYASTKEMHQAILGKKAYARFS